MPNNVRLSNNCYLMKCADFAKIGISNNIEKRMYSIQTSQPFEVDLIRSIKYPSIQIKSGWYLNIAFFIEQKLHEILIEKKLHHKGEWFLNFEKTKEIFDQFVAENDPVTIVDRTSQFLSACYIHDNFKKLFREQMKIKFLEDYSEVLSRVSKKNPRTFDFLKSEKVDAIIQIGEKFK